MAAEIISGKYVNDLRADVTQRGHIRKGLRQVVNVLKRATVDYGVIFFAGYKRMIQIHCVRNTRTTPPQQR